MSELLTDRLDLSTPEKAQKALHDIHAEQKRRAANDLDLTKNQDKMAEDLKAISKTVSEMQQRAKLADVNTADDRSVARYVDGNQVRWTTKTLSNGVVLPGLLDDDRTVCEWQRELRHLNEQRSFVKMIRKGGHSPISDARIAHHMKSAPESIKRTIFGDSAGKGGEWVPDVLTTELKMELYAARRVEALFESFNMTNKNMLIPFLTLASTPYIKSVPTSADPSKFTATVDTSAQRTIEATSMATRCQVDEDMAEDAVIEMIPTVRRSIVASLTDYMEDSILNGDTGTHQDNDLANWNPRSRWGGTVGTSADHRRAFVGLRARAFDVSNTTDQSGAKTYAGFLAARATLDSPHGVSGDLVAIVTPEYYATTLLGLDEVVTVDKMGAQATVLTGQLASLGGVPIIVSEFLTTDLNASGLYDHSTKSYGSMLILNRSRFMVGNYKAGTVELDKDITRGVIDVVGTRRATFFTIDSSTKKNVHNSFKL